MRVVNVANFNLVDLKTTDVPAGFARFGGCLIRCGYEAAANDGPRVPVAVRAVPDEGFLLIRYDPRKRFLPFRCEPLGP